MRKMLLGPWRYVLAQIPALLIVLAAYAILLTGCATGAVAPPKADLVSFDRAAFAFMMSDVKSLIDRDCAAKKKTDVDCARMREQYEILKKQVMTPPAPSVAPAGSGIDIEMLLKLLGVFVGAAT